MLETEYVEDFYSFYEEYEEDILKHISDFLNHIGCDKEIDLDKDLFQSLVDSGNCNFFVVKDEEEFVGYVCVTVTPSVIFKTELDVSIDHLYVKEESRGKGYFPRILEEIEALLKTEGISELKIGLPSTTKHEAFASKNGFSKTSGIFVKRLGE